MPATKVFLEEAAVTAFPKAAISINEFCEAVGLGRTKVYAEIAAGRIKILKAGTRTLVSASEPQAFLARLAAR